MILRRLGNKKQIAKEIQKHFPPHNIYIEPFFGAGGMFFYKPKVKYNIVNDLDSDVFNLFQVVSNQKDELVKAFFDMPIHSDLLKYWQENKETEPIKKALRFLFLSNLTFMGSGQGMRFTTASSKDILFKNIDQTSKLIFDVQFNNVDFRKFLTSYQLRGENDNKNTLIYCDPPYLDTNDNYSNSFDEKDTMELFEALEKTGCKYAVSEFNHNLMYDIADNYNLNVIEIGERQNLKNRRTEILVTNYENRQQSLFA